MFKVFVRQSRGQSLLTDGEIDELKTKVGTADDIDELAMIEFAKLMDLHKTKRIVFDRNLLAAKGVFRLGIVNFAGVPSSIYNFVIKGKETVDARVQALILPQNHHFLPVFFGN